MNNVSQPVICHNTDDPRDAAEAEDGQRRRRIRSNRMSLINSWIITTSYAATASRRQQNRRPSLSETLRQKVVNLVGVCVGACDIA